MNKEKLLEMARQYGHWSGQTIEMNDVGLVEFAKMIAAQERERCAKLLEYNIEGMAPDSLIRLVLETSAAGIRANVEGEDE